MAVSVEEVKQRIGLTAEREKKIKARAAQLIAEEMTLRQLRQAKSLTQENLAKVLGVEQDSISKAERRTDMLLSTMASFVEALGGKLKLVAEFPDREPILLKVSQTKQKNAKLPRQRRAKAKA